jgi:ABC-type cobalamin/Fe3+-siderophores transport system ATPase subunit
MIEIRDVTKIYGRTTAVDHLTVTVKPGIVAGFLGPNGAGKSTTMRMVLGLDRPTSGEILVAGRPYDRHSAPLHEVGEEFMIDRKRRRLSAVLLVVGFISYVIVGLLHPDGPANNHSAVFAEYARSASWTAVHLGQFAGMAVITAGLLVLCFALDVRTGGAAGADGS